jgi:Cys-tRNA(Pro)/Cys-tRNA(Cys) deacylase
VKTNATRFLEKIPINYALREYEVDLSDLSAPAVAAKIGMPPEQVFKTLLTRGDVTGYLFAVIPGDSELDLKALARVSGNRRVEMAPLNQLQSLTGYIRGGVTVLAARKAFPAFLCETASHFDIISVSAGVRGTQILLAPADYVKATGATTGAISRKTAAEEKGV